MGSLSQNVSKLIRTAAGFGIIAAVLVLIYIFQDDLTVWFSEWIVQRRVRM